MVVEALDQMIEAYELHEIKNGASLADYED